ncbi:hypothetical protein [Sphingomonas immobilis]|uniref:Uncharacterized protein n=1 Tax=Sphingomonas immobilis TaxID=3063997 RepID=A0ABT8ZXI1_9SPHN|nr:hypothetical protein [Sphingomonas sp. CA1-15]MDO7841849.1 hypothetical protein [Sphingomonas sp. CA1-15]
MRLFAIAALALIAASSAPWVLGDIGLSQGGHVVKFGVPRAAAIAAVSAVSGKPIKAHSIPDCGQGEPMSRVEFRNGLGMEFLRGKFSGWTLDGNGDRSFKTSKGVGIGATLATLKKAYPSVTVDDGSLGVMFTVENGPSGFLDNTKPTAHVTSLYSGETCMIS